MSTNSGNSNSGSSNQKVQSFLEALRASQNRSFENGNSEAKTNPFLEFQHKKEAEKKRAEQFLEARKQEWNKVYSSKEKEQQLKIQEIRDRLAELSKQLKKLDVNLTKAVTSPVVEAGEYHEHFLIHLQNAINLFSLNASETNNWLELYNKRSSKKGFYWGMAKSKGNNFTQSNERSVATSIG